MIWKTTYSFIVALFLFTIGLNAQTSTPDLRNCGGWNCTSENFTLNDVFLTLIDTDSNTVIDVDDCDSGEILNAKVMLNYSSNASNTINSTRVFADLVIDGETTYINSYLGDVPGKGEPQSRQIYPNDGSNSFEWECGTELLLQNILVAWRTGGNTDIQYNYDCNSYNKTQCEFPTSTIIAAPLAVQFDYTVCRENGTTTVNYSSTTNGGVAPYTFSWDFNDDGTPDSSLPNPTFTTSSSEDFTTTLTVIDDQGTDSDYTVLISNPSEINVTGDIIDINCDASSLGSVDITISGGTDPFIVSWEGPNGFSSTSEDITNLEAGTYTITVNDTYGCEKSASFTIEQDPTPVVEAGNNMELNCSTSSVTLDGSGTSTNADANLTYSWSGPGDFSATSEDATVSNPGIYTLTVTDTDNGCSSSDTVEVTQDSTTPVAEAGDNKELACTITSITLDGSATSANNNANLSYAWSGPDGFTSDLQSPSVDAIGIYTLTVTDADNGCFGTDTVEVTQDITAPVAEAGDNKELTCTITSITLDGSATSANNDANLSYAWSGPDGFTSDLQSPSV
ncbi:PKD domain-containing protein, partial [Gramella sp. KN1008]|uniref:PKD domain-containing protein n=1 Tax=Gramella sp. KN1008 TaxID=2529298 RepID=UPI0010386B03